MTDIACPLPGSLSHDDARAMFNGLKKEMPGLTDAQYRREAARRLNVDYDTYLAAWKKLSKQTKPPPVRPSPTPAPPPVLTRLTKEKATPHQVDYFSSTLKSTAKDSTRIKQGGQTIGYIQKAQTGFYEMEGRIRTGRFITERRGYIVLDETGKVIKDGQKFLFHSADEAVDVLKRKSGVVTPKPLPTPKPPSVPAPAPTPTVPTPPATLTHEAARKEFTKVKRSDKSLTDAQARRKAAENMGVDYDTYLKTWKKPKGKTDTVVRQPATQTVRHPVPDHPPVPEVPPKSVFRRKSDTKAVTSGDAYKADLNEINPGRQFGATGSVNNCTSCTTSFELRRRGYDVRARGMPKGQPLSDVYRSWNISGSNQIIDTGYASDWIGVGIPQSVSRAGWLRQSTGLPDGARGFITVRWNKGGGSHIFNWEKIDGEIVYFDAQIKTRYTAEQVERRVWNRADPDKMYIARVDNIPETREVAWLVDEDDLDWGPERQVELSRGRRRRVRRPLLKNTRNPYDRFGGRDYVYQS